MEKKRKMEDFKSIGDNEISCGNSCEGRYTQTNSAGKSVCALLHIPTKEPGDYKVVLGTSAEEMRECIELNTGKNKSKISRAF